MRVIGFNFTKISVEKEAEVKEGLKIKTSIDVRGIKEVKTNLLKTKDELLEVTFSYGVNYEPQIAGIDLRGVVLVSLSQKESKDVLKEWKSNKNMPESFKYFVLNIIMRKSGLKAVSLEDEFGLPLHIPFPSIKKEDKK